MSGHGGTGGGDAGRGDAGHEDEESSVGTGGTGGLGGGQGGRDADTIATDKFVEEIEALTKGLGPKDPLRDTAPLHERNKDIDAFDFDLSVSLDSFFQDKKNPTTSPIGHAIAELFGLGKKFRGLDEFSNPIVDVTKSIDPFAIGATLLGGPIAGMFVDAIVPDVAEITIGRAQDVFGPKSPATEPGEEKGGGQERTVLSEVIPDISIAAAFSDEEANQFNELVADALNPAAFEFFQMPEFNLLSNDFGKFTFDFSGEGIV